MLTLIAFYYVICERLIVGFSLVAAVLSLYLLLEFRRHTKLQLTVLAVVAFLLSITALALPDREGVKLITAAYVADTVINDKDVRRVAGKSVKVLEDWIDSLSELNINQKPQ